mgnify:CR=1 FL=1
MKRVLRGLFFKSALYFISVSAKSNECSLLNLFFTIRKVTYTKLYLFILYHITYINIYDEKVFRKYTREIMYDKSRIFKDLK